MTSATENNADFMKEKFKNQNEVANNALSNLMICLFVWF